jgi:hypothetical protein
MTRGREVARGLIAVGLAGAALGGCVVPSAPGPSVPAPAGVVAADARALRFGTSAPEVFQHPDLREPLRALFGADWQPGRLAHGAPAFFPPNSPLRLVRVEGEEYIAVTGCVPAVCATYRGLLLIRQDGARLLARLDEGGFAHYYEYGPGAPARAVPRPLLDGAWNALTAIERR